MDKARLGRIASRAGAALVVALLVAGAIVARRHGVDGPTIQREIRELGILGAPLFLLLFALGELLHLPGLLFVVAARVVFGPTLGFFLGYVGAVFALTVAFSFARHLTAAARATREPWRPRWRFLRRAFDRLEAHPVQTVALLRLVLWLTPPLTYALAVTRLRVRDHLVGSAIGILPPVLAVVLLSGFF